MVVELQFVVGQGLVLTQGSLTAEWARAYIRHYLEDASTLLEQVIARDIEGEIEVKYLFDLI